MKGRRLLIVALIAMLTLACGLGGKKEAEPEVAAPLSAEAETVPEVESAPAEPPAAAPAVEEEAEESAPEPVAEEAAVTASDAPMFFFDDFDGAEMSPDWYTEYYYYVDEDVEEDDEEYNPVYEISQRRGALRFEIDSPYLYLYQIYGPHVYEDVRIDLEVENKGVNTNNISLVCRYTDYGWYEFIATSGGYYSIMRYYEDENKELAYGGIRSIRFGKEKKNVFTAICNSRTLTFIVNDVEIAKVKDEEIPDPGLVGYNISSEAYLPVQVEVNWVEISSP